MREPDICNVEYCGYKTPKTPEELEFEILGLKTVICEAKKRMATLKQSGYLVDVTIKEEDNDYNSSK